MRYSLNLLGSIFLAVASIAMPLRNAVAEICDGSVALQVNRSALGFITQAVSERIPTTFVLPAVKKEIMDWPITSEDAEVVIEEESVVAHLLLVSLDIIPGHRLLHLDTRMNINASGPLTIENPYASFGSAHCNLDLNLENVGIKADVEVSALNGVIQTEIRELQLDLDEDHLKVALKSCTLGTVLSPVVGFVKKFFLGFVEDKLSEIAKERITERLKERLNEAITITRDIKGVALTGSVDAVTVSPEGIFARLDADIAVPMFAQPSCLADVAMSATPRCLGISPAPNYAVQTMFAAGISEALVNQMVDGLWRNGTLCISSETLDQPGLTMKLDQIGSSGLLGIPNDTKIAFDVTFGRAPRIQLIQGQGLRLVVDELKVDLTLTPPGQTAQRIQLSANVTASAQPWIDPATNAIALELDNLDVTEFRLGSNGEGSQQLNLEPERLRRFISDVALPLVQSRLASLSLSPSVIGVSDFLVELKKFNIEHGVLGAAFDLHQRRITDDKATPETTLVKGPGSIVGPKVISFHVSGTDNETQTALMRYSYRVDQGAWSKPNYYRRIDLTLDAGKHRIELAAIDQQGNSDITPVVVPLLVDAQAPALYVPNRPDSLIHSNMATIRVGGEDDHSPTDKLKFNVKLYKVFSQDGSLELLSETAPSWDKPEAVFQNLKDGLYKARVSVEDEAGNLASTDVGFVVDASEGGCRVAGESFSWIALALVALFIVRRRNVRH